MSNIKDLVGDVLAAPLGEIIAAVGQGVADAQQALDRGSLAQLLEIYGHADTEELKLLQQIGYQPTFYALPETTGEIQVALSISGQSSTATAPATNAKHALISRLQPRIQPTKLYAAPVNADLTNRYGFQSSAAARIQFKIVPVPAPGQASDIRVIPNLVGMTLANAQQLTNQLDLELTITDQPGEPLEHTDGSANITSQRPNPGDIVLAGNQVEVQLD